MDAPKSQAPSVHVNGQSQPLTVDGTTTALDWLRGLGLTGAKEGCAEGECGACAVLVARPDGQWHALNSCLLPAAALDGAEVVTSEGLGTPQALHPVQAEMAQRGGSQCGYCTPGFVCAMAAEYYRPDRRPVESTSSEVGTNGFDLHALSGNLCRCTGYRPIRDAAFALGEVADDDELPERAARVRPAPPRTLGPRSRAFLRPADLGEALEALTGTEGAVAVAGCTDWGVEVNHAHRRPPLVVALDQVPQLRRLQVSEEMIEIGAALTLSEIEHELAGSVPILDELIELFASRLIRNRATLGGNIATASPIGDSPPVLLALDAAVVLTSAHGERRVPLVDFFTGYRQTVRAPGELITAVQVPLPLLPQSSFLKVAKRRFDDISSVAVAIAADLGGGTVQQIRIGLGGVAATPLRARATEAALTGRPWTAETVRAAAATLSTEGTPLDDHRASARYRAAMLSSSLLRFYDLTATEVAS